MNRFKKHLARLVCIFASTGAPAVYAQTVVEYIHTDALGTPIAVTDASRNVIERSEYEPFGQLLNRPLTDGPGFTGHVQDAATGLTYMQQRYYDPLIGRFLSVDPIAAGVNSAFNRYSYVGNNPYRFIDPDGRYRCEAGSGDCRSLKESLRRLREAIRTTRSSKARARLTKISEFYGVENDGNGVTVYQGTGQAPKAGPNGEVTGGTVTTSSDGKTDVYIDFSGLAKASAQPGFPRGTTYQSMVDAFVVHEGSHGAQQRNLLSRGLYPMYRAEKDRRNGEIAAYWDEAIFHHLSGTNSPWLLWTKSAGYDDSQINNQVEQSMNISNAK